MKMLIQVGVSLGVLIALAVDASANCQIPLAGALGPKQNCGGGGGGGGGGGLPPPEPNRLAGPDGNPIPSQNRCGADQMPPGDCPQYQDVAYFTNHCINATEYNYARNHSIAPICNQFVPTQYIGFCYCGCLEQATEIFVMDPASGKNSVQQVGSITMGSVQIQALTDDTTLSSVKYAPRGLEAVTTGAEREPLVVLHLDGGVTLAVTELHAILLSTGAMVAAKDLQAEQSLVKQDGSLSRIAEITRASTTDNVFNVLTSAGLKSFKGHMIVANGLIVGDLMWQNTLAKDLNAIVVRR